MSSLTGQVVRLLDSQLQLHLLFEKETSIPGRDEALARNLFSITRWLKQMMGSLSPLCFRSYVLDEDTQLSVAVWW